MPFPATPPTEMYLAIQLPNPISILVNYLPVSQTPIETLRYLVNASDVNAIVMDEFMTWPHFVQPESPFRAYFSLLLDRGVIPAIYLEDLRQASNFLTVAHGLTLLNSVAPSDPYACFANGLFLTSLTRFSPLDGIRLVVGLPGGRLLYGGISIKSDICCGMTTSFGSGIDIFTAYFPEVGKSWRKRSSTSGVTKDLYLATFFLAANHRIRTSRMNSIMYTIGYDLAFVTTLFIDSELLLDMIL
ncbi:unnamed protein product [Arabidopsis arenosa]|uniref:Uncharacterized protein n=1 Tax=Arabidopsis arenosa TaxID=38785 RepID=A0A8S2ACL9_ARAAE|nr:unnamed protein product [Arabidopsis arenosa]